MIDPNRTRQMLRSVLLQLLQAKRQAGPGSWQQQVEAEVTDDGRTLLVAAAVPLRPAPADAPTTTPPPQPRSSPPEHHIGRPAKVSRDLYLWLQAHPDSHHADILDAMEAKGHSRTATNDNLASMVRLGWVSHEGKGQPYRWCGPDTEST